jgi:hypothetical protein
MSLETLKKPVVLMCLEQGAVIEYSTIFQVANIQLNGEQKGRIHLATFNSLCLKGKLKEIAHDSEYKIYSLNNDKAMEAQK